MANYRKIKATIYFTVDNEHPDIKYISNPSEIQSFTDTYCFNLDIVGYDVTRNAMENYCKRDLRLVAGGGYNDDHIHNVRFEFEEV